MAFETPVWEEKKTHNAIKEKPRHTLSAFETTPAWHLQEHCPQQAPSSSEKALLVPTLHKTVCSSFFVLSNCLKFNKTLFI